MKIGIITFHCSYNFGSALQAFALQEAIRRMGHEAAIVDYRSADFNRYRLFIPSRHPSFVVSELRNLSRSVKRRSAFRRFWRDRLNLTSETYSYRDVDKMDELNTSFDGFVCGSDQIWNLDCTNGVEPPFFLSFVSGDKRKVAYAPSLAHTHFRTGNFDPDEVARLLASFDAISVREGETVGVFQPLVDRKIAVTADPTILLPRSTYESMVSDVAGGPYIFVYELRDCPELIESAREMASASGERVLYVSEKHLDIPNSMNLFGVGPEDFLSLISHADLVISNSFHAMVFSVIFQKPFRAFETSKDYSRQRDLLGKLGLSGCLSSTADSRPVPDIDWDSCVSRFEGLREESLAFLGEALA
jgi:hypothetical protein